MPIWRSYPFYKNARIDKNRLQKCELFWSLFPHWTVKMLPFKYFTTTFLVFYLEDILLMDIFRSQILPNTFFCYIILLKIKPLSSYFLYHNTEYTFIKFRARSSWKDSSWKSMIQSRTVAFQKWALHKNVNTQILIGLVSSMISWK